MRRMPLGVAIFFNIILLFAAFNGLLSNGGIILLIINIILTLPALFRYIDAVEEKKELKRELKKQEAEKAKALIGALIYIIRSEEKPFYIRITALVTLNDFFVFPRNRTYLSDLKDDDGNLINEYTMSLFIANYSERLMTHPDATDDLKEILNKLSYNREKFASKRLEPMLKRTFKNMKKQMETI